MSEPQPNNSFSWGDALFLYIERPGQPLSIASVSVFEGAISLKACRDFVESKLPEIPRYRQRVAFPPFNIGLPELAKSESEFRHSQSHPPGDAAALERKPTSRHSLRRFSARILIASGRCGT